ncbi:hypothetical protein D3C73_878230 [compost metagenome]
MLAEPAFEHRPDFSQRLCAVDVGLGDVGQFPAKRRQQGATQRAHEPLEMILFAPLAIHQRGADFDDFHFRDRPTAFIGGGFQINDQPMRHCRVPDIRVLMGLSVAKASASA